MKDIKTLVNDTVEELKQERDELRVKMNLAKMEVKEEWDEVEEKLIALDSHAKRIRNATVEASKDVGAAAKLLIDEIRDGFKDIAKKI